MAQRRERNRGRREWRRLRLQSTTPEQVGFVAAAQIGQLDTVGRAKGKGRRKSWFIITSADSRAYQACALLDCRRGYWGIEAKLHQRLDISLDEDRSRVRTPKGLFMLGLFRRLTISLACAWLAQPDRQKAKLTTRDFQRHLAADKARLAFALVTSVNPKAWNAK
jgi:hypothetical protein